MRRVRQLLENGPNFFFFFFRGWVVERERTSSDEAIAARKRSCGGERSCSDEHDYV